ncbi:putative toxin-antitoxin system toxin component, PIN family [Thermococcus henrietii]|uniref:putative toxin-antitoxin system toxin component, PIN family n=1 Tax=Thermococcus henrietii TaxID=2016361 RepID=UPI000C06AD65|nr:putative toxin-antitoxin system toxin component, PIN family [Thermococcus henrietii]
MGANREKTKTVRPRVVIDTSVLFSAVISTKGYAFEVLELLARGGIINCVSSQTLDEYYRKLTSRKALKYISLEEAIGYLTLVESLSEMVVIKHSFQNSEDVLEKVRDPEDIPFLDVVYNAEAEFLITYDRRHLVKIRDEDTKKFKLRGHEFYILTPDEFIHTYRRRKYLKS